MPSRAKPSICRPPPGAGVDLSSPWVAILEQRKLHDLAIRGAISASFSTSLSAFLVTNNPLTRRLFLFLKPFDAQNRIYK